MLTTSLLERGATNSEENNQQTNASEEIETCGIAEVIADFQPNCIVSKNTLDEMSKHLKSHGFEHNTAFETGRVHLYLRTL
ncbi:MAG: hypothetical protein P8Y36_12580 [Alphaproteobacteria bacterium]